MNSKINNLKIKLIVLLMILSSAFIFVGCNQATNKGTKIDTVVDYEWSYQREFIDEHDSDMVIDGVLDEERWQGQQYLTHKENGVEMSFTTVFTKYGLYIGAKVKDSAMKWNGRFNFAGFWQSTSNNSAFGFKIQGADVTEEHATNVFNFFVDAKNAASRNQTHFEAKSTTNGNIDERTATEMTSELFVSWDALNIEIEEGKDYPDYVRIYTAYRSVYDVDSSNNNCILNNTEDFTNKNEKSTDKDIIFASDIFKLSCVV